MEQRDGRREEGGGKREVGRREGREEEEREVGRREGKKEREEKGEGREERGGRDGYRV